MFLRKLSRISSGVLPIFALIALCVAASVTLAHATPPLGSFSLFNSARVVVGGTGSNTAAVDLTSNCGAEAFNSTCYGDPTFTSSGLAFTPSGSLTVSGITTLSTDYDFGGANCSGGSPRFVLRGTSGVITCGYFGTPPSFTSCNTGWLNSGNWASMSDTTRRWDDGCNGTAAHDWADIASQHSNDTVTEVDLIVDGGWTDPKGQDLMVDTLNVNGTVMNGTNVH